MLDEAGGAQGDPVHGALNDRSGRLAVITRALAFAALQGGEKVGIGIDATAQRSALQIQTHGDN